MLSFYILLKNVTNRTAVNILYNLSVLITIVQFSLQVFIFMDATLTSIYNFQVSRPCCVEYAEI